MNKELEQVLKSGGVAVIPTDTMYGIVGSALSKSTVERIYRVRERDPRKPLIILVNSIENLKDLGIKNIPTNILKTLWPNKISVILPCKSKKFEYLHRGTNKLSFRIPDHAGLRALLKKTGPIVAPSANPEGKAPAKTIKEAENYFGTQVDIYVDQKKLKDVPSTIIELDTKSKISLVREGAVPFSKITHLLQN